MLTLPSHPQVKVLHIEPTDFCNAACPQCPREIDETFDKNNIHHLSVEQIQDIIDVKTIKRLEKMYTCGVYGEPAAGKYTLDIYNYFRRVNPRIMLGMNTNGSLRTPDWWAELAKILKRHSDYVVFSLDGLADTNHIYRVNTDWYKIMANVEAFISAGGRAHWDMLVFEHNEHQVDTAQQLAKDMGFKWFRAKVSKRFITYPVDFLKRPKAWRDPVTNGDIKCYSIETAGIYLSSQGTLYPCPMLGVNTEHTLDQFDSIQKTWATNEPNYICFRNCASNETGTSFTNQWQREVEF